MQNILEDETQIELFGQIQRKLISLEPNTTDDKIKELIDQIPQHLLTKKDDLMMICELFAIYSRNKNITKKKNIFKLFDNIMIYIKKYLQNESIFFWNIFGGLRFLQLWMYQEGLISIETIILLAKKNNDIATYFLPEIYENEPEIFEKEIKYMINCPNTTESIKKIKELRQKHLKWICESGDYNDPLYSEIETDQLSYIIVTDNIEAFQKITSRNNIKFDLKIKKSLISNYTLFRIEETLFEYALEHRAFKISKFLIMNNIKLTDNSFYSATTSEDYDMIHLVESKLPEKAPEYLLCNAISHWDDDLTNYVFNNYIDYDFLEKVDVNIENKDKIFNIIEYAFRYVDFIFIRSKLIPFFKNNQNFLRENINEIINLSFSDFTGFFSKELIKHPNFDVNYYSDETNFSILGNAIYSNNSKAVEILLKNEKIDINKISFKKFTPLMLAIGIHSDMKIVEMICKNKDINVHLKDERYNISAFEYAVSKGNFYSLNYLIDNFINFDIKTFGCLFFVTLRLHYLKTCKVFLYYFLKMNINKKYDEIINSIKAYKFHANYRDEYLDDFKKVYNEIIDEIVFMD